MDTYEALRRRARQKRDSVVTKARIEYEQTLNAIRSLQRRLGAADKDKLQRPRPIIELIREAAPKDRTFTLAEVVDHLKAAEPLRQFRHSTVRAMFQQLEQGGVLRRVCRANGTAYWACAEYAVDESPYAAASLTDVAADILRESGAMRLPDLVTAMQERGYRASDDPKLIVRSLRSAFRRNCALFDVGEDERWSVAS